MASTCDNKSVNVQHPTSNSKHRDPNASDLGVRCSSAPAVPSRGSGLIIVLWIVALLSLLISGFAFDMHVEARIVSYCRKRLKAEYLAQAGLERARMLMARSKTIKGVNDPDDVKAQPWYKDAKRLKQGFGVMGVTDALGEGQVRLDIIPEPARRNLNALKDEDWERILKVGGIPEDRWSELVDSYNDWRDADDQPNIDGAETDDYYSRLEPPYKARGHKGQAANLDTVDELLLIKGFTRSILYGGYEVEDDTNSVHMAGIADLLTANAGAGGQVNVNAATKRALMTLPGIDDAIADAIIAEREGLTAGSQMSEDYYFTDVNNFFARVGELSGLNPADQARLRTLVSTASQVFRISSKGVVHGVEYRITSVVTL
jgi:general secretion pathway protein K